ncbi:hypothetical protein [Pseudonocardia sp.]|jgi:hypothetical protein|uniref:hypothetical protein n=1 Tax=Pseudonocardia sp. TaxID=60912 RepID=UPI0031FBE8E4
MTGSTGTSGTTTTPEALIPAQRTAPEPAGTTAGPASQQCAVQVPPVQVPPVLPVAAGAPCRCGHGSEAHEHFRAGTDCARCGCGRFRDAKGLKARIAALLGRR